MPNTFCKAMTDRNLSLLVITELKLLWTELLMVHTKPRHPQSQGSVERLTATLQNYKEIDNRAFTAKVVEPDC